jgi:NitT/TauT family transport system substrate-binding protein
MVRLLLIWLAITACTASSVSAETIERPRVAISIGAFVIGFLPLPLAHAQGWFREQGLDVELENFQASGTKALEALIGGSTDAVVGAYDYTARMQTRGKDIRCVILLNTAPGIAVAVRRDLVGKIRTVGDLKGAMVGITSHGTALDYIFRNVAAGAGLAPEDVRIVPVGSGKNAIAAMETRSIDAVVHQDPAITVMQRSGLAKVILDIRSVEQTRAVLGGEYPFTCLYTTARFIERNPITMQRLVNAFAKALAFIDERTAVEIADATPAEYQLGGRDIFIEMLEATKEMFPAVGRFDPADLARPVQLVKKFDEAFRSASIRIENTYTNRFVDAVPPAVAGSEPRP